MGEWGKGSRAWRAYEVADRALFGRGKGGSAGTSSTCAGERRLSPSGSEKCWRAKPPTRVWTWRSCGDVDLYFKGDEAWELCQRPHVRGARGREAIDDAPVTVHHHIDTTVLFFAFFSRIIAFKTELARVEYYAGAGIVSALSPRGGRGPKTGDLRDITRLSWAARRAEPSRSSMVVAYPSARRRVRLAQGFFRPEPPRAGSADPFPIG